MDSPDDMMQNLMGKPWSSWNLPEQPNKLDLKKLRDGYLPPDQYRVHHQSTSLPARYLPLFGLYPADDFLSITKCPGCGWLLKVQHAFKHFLRDSRGAIVCKETNLAFFKGQSFGKPHYPTCDLEDTYSQSIDLRSSYETIQMSSATIIGMISESRSISHSLNKGQLGSSTTTSASSHASGSLTLPGSQGNPELPHSSASSVRSPSKGSSSHKSAQSTSTLSIPAEDMCQNESVEDLLMSNITHSNGSSKHTVHIIATSNTGNKSKPSDPDYDHLNFYADVPDKRLKLDSYSHSNDHHHKTPDSHTNSNDNDSHDKCKSTDGSSTYNEAVSSHSNSSTDTSKKSKSTLSLSKNDGGSPNRHHDSAKTESVVALSAMSSSGPSKSPQSSGLGVSCSSKRSLEEANLQECITIVMKKGVGYYSGANAPEEQKEKEKSSPQKKKKRKRDKDEPRKVIPLKDRDFNPDKHCGVVVSGSNGPCKRSLTCRTHSVASRRAVVGRSQSFDALLAAHKLAKCEEKGSTKPKETVEEVAPPQPKKKKLSGSANTTTTVASPNDDTPLVKPLCPTTFVRPESPDIEIVAVIAKPNRKKPSESANTTTTVAPTNVVTPLVKPLCPSTVVRPESPDIEIIEVIPKNPSESANTTITVGMEGNAQSGSSSQGNMVFVIADNFGSSGGNRSIVYGTMGVKMLHLFVI